MPKWGFTALTPGSSLNLRFSTLMPSRDGAAASVGGVDGREAGSDNKTVLVVFGLLSSYELMGKAAIVCDSG